MMGRLNRPWYGRWASARPAKWLLLGCWLMLSGCGPAATPDVPRLGSAEKSSLPTVQTRESLLRVERFCGDCHPLPLPETFAKKTWEEEVIQGFDFYIASKRTDLEEPSRQEAIRYFVDRAPAELQVPRADSLPVIPAAVDFKLATLQMPLLDQPVSYSHLVVDQASRSLWTADMRGGDIRRWQWQEPLGDLSVEQSALVWTTDRIGNGRNSCRITPCDWNQDGAQDWLVGEIGTYGVSDHSNGRVSVLVYDADAPDNYRPLVLAEGLARVVEAQTIDYDQDGDLDVLVAEFGWLETGSLMLLRNPGGDPMQAQLTIEKLDSRHGVLGVQVTDLNRDGHLDYVTAYGQEFESVEVHYGEGNGKYRGQLLLALPDPSYNSSSFQVVDVDGDGLLDILHTNGDTLDAFIAKPYHGVRWLKNLGGDAWETRELGLLVGALQTAVADFDGDGDLDIVAVSLFPAAHLDGPGAYDSVVWWEQQTKGAFVRHSIERDRCDYTSCAVADVNGDERPDVILGGWSTGIGAPSLRVYLNQPAKTDEAGISQRWHAADGSPQKR